MLATCTIYSTVSLSVSVSPCYWILPPSPQTMHRIHVNSLSVATLSALPTVSHTDKHCKPAGLHQMRHCTQSMLPTSGLTTAPLAHFPVVE